MMAQVLAQMAVAVAAVTMMKLVPLVQGGNDNGGDG